MDTSQSLDMLVGSRVRYREADGKLAFELPARPRRMLSRFGATFAIVAAFLLFIVFLSNGLRPLRNQRSLTGAAAAATRPSERPAPPSRRPGAGNGESSPGRSPSSSGECQLTNDAIASLFAQH